MQKANLTIADISLFELNEAFSVVVRIAEKVCNIDPAKINVNGYVIILIIYFTEPELVNTAVRLLWVMLSGTPAHALSSLSFTLSNPVSTELPAFAMEYVSCF